MLAQGPRAAAQTGRLALSVAQIELRSRFKVGPRGLIRDALQHAEHRVIFKENAANGRSSVDAKRLEFAQQEQSEDVVEIGVGQHHARNRRLAQALARMQLRRGFDLCAQVWRCAQEKPRAAVLRDCNLCLAARLALERAGSHGATIGAGAIPLRKRASGRRTKNLHQHLCEFTTWNRSRR